MHENKVGIVQKAHSIESGPGSDFHIWNAFRTYMRAQSMAPVVLVLAMPLYGLDGTGAVISAVFGVGATRTSCLM